LTLGLSGRISAVLDCRTFPTAPAQGALAVEIRADDTALAEHIAKMDDRNTRIAAEAERGILGAMHGGCSIPLGVWSRVEGDTITLEGTISDVDGSARIQRNGSAPVGEAADLARKLAQDLLDGGARSILARIRQEKS